MILGRVIEDSTSLTKASERIGGNIERVNLKTNVWHLVRLFFFCAAISLIVGSALSIVAGQQCVVGRISEADLRRHAKKQVLPDFPKRAKDLGVKGVAVVELQFDAASEISSIHVIQSPNRMVDAAITEAANKWVFDFRQDRNETPMCFEGKLTFYFVNENGNAWVKHPKRFGGK